MHELARRLGLRTNPLIFFWSAGLMVFMLAVLLMFPEPIGAAFSAGREWITFNLGWFFVIGVTAWLVFLIWAAFSRYGNLKLGAEGDKPEFTNLSWFAMLFAGGIGTVLMFWGVAEPISHFTTPPFDGVEPYSAQAAQDAMAFSMYHLSLHTWAIFTLPGLAFGFFIYRYKLPMRVSSVFYPLLGERIHGRIGRTIDIFAVLGTLFGLAVSVGLGTSQISAGISAMTGLADSTELRVGVVLIIAVVATWSVASGLERGIKRLSNINILAAIGLMLFVLFVGETVFLLRQMIESVGLYATQIIPLSFWNDALATYTDTDGWGWQAGWTVFYWAWTVTWAPYMGVFLARISRGRTVREFVVGVLVAPAAFTVVWFVIFGWSAMAADGIGGEGGPISAAVAESVPLAMFAFFEQFPLSTVVSGIAIVIVMLFLITSADSASLVVDMLCTGKGEMSPLRQRVFWALSLGGLAAALLLLGGDTAIEALQEVITVIGLPIFILVCGMMVALLVGFRREVPPRTAVVSGHLREQPTEVDAPSREVVSGDASDDTEDDTGNDTGDPADAPGESAAAQVGPPAESPEPRTDVRGPGKAPPSE
ncbi:MULTISPECIES: BCCT family transporter [Pseudonocardia]|uniref:High-affinity choline transport protein n=2 Tax=Pseudonocardia TaxID=1847 RepID=A0A1Y2MMA1_PSEAH|nr:MULTISPECIES: BCCT family transporter [Pseudonocardia]OSY36394.1 High-affinity choline transport protein [Pseudonocardia autotrophica]TDN72650.1 choline/carnitine/betaine transport [Pseudonocardia autotrophica]BBG03362.1 multidrug DMT transporter permease [Pseudonocardia autotrophica]GEC29589.1 multidrug DMT transporter permease [Pseudonocardia saturnea]